MSDVDKTKEAILEIFRRDETTAPAALCMMSVMAARMIASSCNSTRHVQAMAEKYFGDVAEALAVTQGVCGCPNCCRHLN